MKTKTYQRRQSCSFKAIQFDGENFSEIKEFCPNARFPVDSTLKLVLITIGDGYSRKQPKNVLVNKTDWIIWYQGNDFNVMEDFEFRFNYEEVK